MGLPPWPWAAFSFPLLSSLGGSTGSAGVWGSVPRLNRVLHRRAHRRAPCVGTTVPWASWGFGCSVALRGPCGVLGGRIWLKGHRVVALAGSGTSPRQHERSVLLAFSHLRPERIGLPAQRGREPACPRARGPREQLSVALATRLAGRRSPASCYSRT